MFLINEILLFVHAQGLEGRIALLEKKLAESQGGVNSKAQIVSSLFDDGRQQDGDDGKQSSPAASEKTNPCTKVWGGPIMPASDQNLW